jgi:hypothetical protein
MKKVLVVVAVVLAVALVSFFTVVPLLVDLQMNTVVSREIPAVSPAGSALHRRIFVADLHADALLWGRDLLSRVSRGHVDLPRLQEAKVALQVFSVVTKTPRDMNYDKNTGATDNIALLSLAQRWPAATRTSLRARAVYQAEKLQDAVLRAGGAITLKLIARRRNRDGLRTERKQRITL